MSLFLFWLHQYLLFFSFFATIAVSIPFLGYKLSASTFGRCALQEFETIYHDYYKRVFSFLFRLTNSYELSEELTQETFYQAFLSFDRFQGKSDIFTWLASIAKFSYFKYLRKHKKGWEALSLDSLTDEWITEKKDSPEEQLIRSSMMKEIRKALENAPEKYRDVLLLRVYADLSFKQIGAALNISENSAKVIYFRAKNRLAKELGYEFEL